MIERLVSMPGKKSTFGARPQQLDKLLSLGLDTPNAEQESERTTCSEVFREQLGAQVGRYRLLRVLGEGGMAVVFLADQREPVRREVALKVIKPGMDSARVIARFEVEQQALALMDHPHIARVYDAGVAPSGRPYFVMEHVKGIPITEHCDKYQLTIEERLRLFLHVCEAVQHAHQKGVIHRDLKPSNILVAIQDQEAVPKVIDFGVARAISQPLTQRTLFTEQGQLIGTPEYMSPEQADLTNQDIDTRTDVYALGIVLYELLAGVLPFDRKTFREGGVDHIRKVICEEEPKTPSTRLSKTSVQEATESAKRRRTEVRILQRRLHGDLDWITLKALEKDRTRRYATVDALAEDIRRHLGHEPVSAAPPGLVYRTQKLLRRRRREVATAAMGLIVLVGATIAVAMYLKAGREHAHANALEDRQRLTEAQELFGARQYGDALKKLAGLLESPHVGRQATLLHAQSLLGDRGPGAAVSELESLLGTRDEVAGQAHFLLASIYYEGDPCAPGAADQYHERWRQHREQAEQLIAGTAAYYFLRAQATRDIQEMLQLLGKALELDRQHYDSLRERAYIYYAQHDYDKMAMDAYGMIILRPKNPQGYLLRAMARREMGQFEEALQDYNDALQLSPGDPLLYDGRRETYTRMGQYGPALRDALKCEELRPVELSYGYKLFAAYTLTGQYEQAREQCDRMSTSLSPSGEYNPDGLLGNAVAWAWSMSVKAVIESLAADRPWHDPNSLPDTPAHAYMFEADAFYRALSARAGRIIPNGFHPSWSPDGTKLAYSQGLLKGSAVAVLNLQTGRTELLTAPGKDPEWSPDGRYIAFVKDRWLLPLNRLGYLNIRDFTLTRETPGHPEEIWLVDMNSRAMRRIVTGSRPHWGRRSGRLYYLKDNVLYSTSVEQGDSKPTQVWANCGSSPMVSPDERYLADALYRQLRITDLGTREVVATWNAPPIPRHELALRWSPDSRELSIGAVFSIDMGLWIYSLDTRAASKVLNGPFARAWWSHDGRRLAALLGPPFMEIWLTDLKSDVLGEGSLHGRETVEEHCRWLIEKYNRRLELNPACIDGYHVRADCALWMGHERANEYLEQFSRVLTKYDAAGCAGHAQRLLSSPPEQRGRLVPLALLFARKAVAKEPNYAETLVPVLLHAGRKNEALQILQMTPRTVLQGSANYSEATDTYTIKGIGVDIWDSSDDFHFASKTLDGDGSITARIDTIENVHEWTKAGVMIRSTLASDCPNAMLLVTPSGRLSFQYRSTDAEPTLAVYTPLESIQLPHWVRLTRQGNHFGAQHSGDGVHWQDVLNDAGQVATIEIPMDETVYVGLAVTSHDPFRTAEAWVSHVTVTGAVTPAGSFNESKDITLLLPPLPDTAERASSPEE